MGKPTHNFHFPDTLLEEDPLGGKKRCRERPRRTLEALDLFLRFDCRRISKKIGDRTFLFYLLSFSLAGPMSVRAKESPDWIKQPRAFDRSTRRDFSINRIVRPKSRYASSPS